MRLGEEVILTFDDLGLNREEISKATASKPRNLDGDDTREWINLKME